MKKTLCLDFGNTRLKCALFEGVNFIEEMVLPKNDLSFLEELVQKHQPQNSILSSVINHDPAVETLLNNNTNFHKLSHLTKLNFTTPVSKPATIGADRLALVAAAVHFHAEKNNLVIGLGTCITYNFVNQNHQFTGGSISPGMEMRFKAMQEQTALLPLAQKNWNFPILGYDTITNLQSGVIAGMGFEIDGFINYYASKFSNFNVILTGGDAGYFATKIKNKIFADTNFLFKGLYAISEINNKS